MITNHSKSIFLVGAVLISAVALNQISRKNTDFGDAPQFANEEGTALISQQSVPDDRESDKAKVGAAAYGVYSLSGAKISGGGEKKRWPIASVTKLMTAVVARDVFGSKDRFEIGVDEVLIEGNATRFAAGEVFSFEDIEKALLMTSSNVAGEVFAAKYGRTRFIEAMNNYAYNFGMVSTRFADPTGLSYQNQSTVEDLDKLVTFILNKKPEIFAVTKRKTDKISNIKTGKKREVVNINPLAGRTDFIGGKTGTTPEAVGNLVSVFSATQGRPGRVIILLGTENRFEETENLLNTWNSNTKQ